MQTIASFRIGAGPFFPGGRIALHANGVPQAIGITVVGPGSIDGDTYLVPDVTAPTTASVIAGSAGVIAVSDVHIAPPPGADRPLLAVAAYDDGIVLHDPQTFARLGTVATGGNPSDVAFFSDGGLAATDTAGDELTVVTRSPWHVSSVANVPVGNEVAIDPASAAIFVSNRDVGGNGALTRVIGAGAARIVTGQTAEGLAIDPARNTIYVGNVNDGTVLAVDTRALRPLRRIAAVPRVFGLALSPDGETLFAVANQSAGEHFAAPGFVVAIDLHGSVPRIVARSRNLKFPLGVVYDPIANAVLVTDEESNLLYVQSARDLRDLRAPLATCKTPWKPSYDAASQRIFVPCAQANQVDVFDARTLARVRGAPFATGGYPLGVATWHG